jgi:hypothetical protein
MGFTNVEKDIKKDLQKKFGKERGLSIFYARATAGVFGETIQKRHGSPQNFLQPVKDITNSD